ncbi:hypothetical protein DXG01_011711 [Tephrocybe rancida]|nr:hypothetical protein DXG01_011711 [Tephrocybe rancida]
MLIEPLLSSELDRLAAAKSFSNTDCASFQPCPNPEKSSQDRYAVNDWPLCNGTWQFRAVLDGHGGHQTVDHTLNTLPSLIRTDLQELVSEMEPSVDAVSQLLMDAITSVDDKISKDVLELFPDVNAFVNLSDDVVCAIINDQKSGGKNASVISRCMAGTTVLVSLVDPSLTNLWVASLGDCQAALGIHQYDGNWETLLLSSFHNGENPSEKEKVSRQHPDEVECMLENRVFGALAVTRGECSLDLATWSVRAHSFSIAIGDHLFKLPASYTERIFMNAKEGFQFSKNIQDFLWRNKTPPYVSNRADVQHTRLEGKEALLVMCSDGLLDLYAQSQMELTALADYWVQLVARKTCSSHSQDKTQNVNLAIYLLRDALGGDDIDAVSRMMTVEMEYRWMDDTTILVQKL